MSLKIKFSTPTKVHKVADAVKTGVLAMRDQGVWTKEIFRHHAGRGSATSDTRYCPSQYHVYNFINNYEKNNSFQGGQWSAIDRIIRTTRKQKGLVLLYHQDNKKALPNDADHCWVLSVANKDSLTTARANQLITGIDSEHGLQNDGAVLLTSVSMNQDLGCPVAFTVMSKENKEASKWPCVQLSRMSHAASHNVIMPTHTTQFLATKDFAR